MAMALPVTNNPSSAFSALQMGPGSTDLPFATTFVEIEILFFRFPSVFSVDFLHVRQKSGFGLMEGRERKGRGGWGLWEHANTWVLDPSPHAS